MFTPYEQLPAKIQALVPRNEYLSLHALRHAHPEGLRFEPRPFRPSLESPPKSLIQSAYLKRPFLVVRNEANPTAERIILITNQVLGHGGQARVRRAFELDSGEAYALKIISFPRLMKNKMRQRRHFNPARYMELALQERSVLEAFKMYQGGAILSTSSGPYHIYTLMTLIHGDDLQHVREQNAPKRITGPLTDEVIQIFWLLLKAADQVKKLHEAFYVHRDIKLGNMMYDSEHDCCTLTDMGYAIKSDEKGFYYAQKSLGTESYKAPEIVHQEGKLRYAFSFQSDIFALGKLFEKFLFGDKVLQEPGMLSPRRFFGLPGFSIIPTVSREARTLITQMTVLTPEQRPSPTEVIRALEGIIKKVQQPGE